MLSCKSLIVAAPGALSNHVVKHNWCILERIRYRLTCLEIGVLLHWDLWHYQSALSALWLAHTRTTILWLVPTYNQYDIELSTSLCHKTSWFVAHWYSRDLRWSCVEDNSSQRLPNFNRFRVMSISILPSKKFGIEEWCPATNLDTVLHTCRPLRMQMCYCMAARTSTMFLVWQSLTSKIHVKSHFANL